MQVNNKNIVLKYTTNIFAALVSIILAGQQQGRKKKSIMEAVNLSFMGRENPRPQHMRALRVGF